MPRIHAEVLVEEKAVVEESRMTAENDPTEKKYFYRLIDMLDEKGWMRVRIDESVQRWLQNHDHYRFVSMVRPVAQDWVDIMESLGVREEHAQQVRAAIENQLCR